MNLSELADDLEEFKKDIKKDINRYAINIVKKIAWHVIEHTPVDITTGVSNWVVSQSRPSSQLFPTIEDEPKSKRRAYFIGTSSSTKDQSRSMAINFAIQNANAKIPGKRIYISNLTSYIVKLNTGEYQSAQEPPGFVERAIHYGLKHGKKS